jgi:hypothetical protein
MTQKEIFNLSAFGLIKDLPQNVPFKEAILNSMGLKGVVDSVAIISILLVGKLI